jgi:SAM-dependent methyltransferase
VTVPLSDVFASNALVRWLRGDPGRYELLTRMIGARLGDRLLSCGAGDPGLVAALAKVTGLSGRAVAHATTAEEAARLLATAETAGVLVDVVESPDTALPFSEGDFDLVLVDAVSAQVATLLPEIHRVLRPGGRVVLVIRQKAPQAPVPSDIKETTSVHFKGARVLFERDGFGIVEALKGRLTSA